MSARVDLLRRFGAVPDWLSEAIERMNHQQWVGLHDWIEASERIPPTLRSTMPTSPDTGMIQDPNFENAFYKAQMLAAWDAWSKIWGTPPWADRKLTSIQPRLPYFRD